MTWANVRYVVAGLVVVGFLAWIVIGQVKHTVHPILIGRWGETLHECPSEDFPRDVLEEAVDLWRAEGFSIVIDCGAPSASIVIDPTVDIRASVDDLAIRHGVTGHLVLSADGEITGAATRMLPGPTVEWTAHEIGHQLGFAHPNFCPSGHVMHPHNAGTKDFRGHTAVDYYAP